jgi:hypothetical protein
MPASMSLLFSTGTPNRDALCSSANEAGFLDIGRQRGCNLKSLAKGRVSRT